MLSLFKKNVHQDTIEKIEFSILNSQAFKHFKKENPDLLVEYKIFEVGIFSAAVYSYNLQRKAAISKEVEKEIMQIYFKRGGDFIREYILTKRLLFDILSSSVSENLVILKVIGNFDDYIKDIGDSIHEGKPYWIEEFEEPEYDEDMGCSISGEKTYFSFLYKLFLCDLENDYGKYYVKKKEIWELEDFEFSMLEEFVNGLDGMKRFVN